MNQNYNGYCVKSKEKTETSTVKQPRRRPNDLALRGRAERRVYGSHGVSRAPSVGLPGKRTSESIMTRHKDAIVQLTQDVVPQLDMTIRRGQPTGFCSGSPSDMLLVLRSVVRYRPLVLQSHLG